MTVLFAVLAALGLTAWLSHRFCDPSSRFHILDTPNERSLHENPTPRSGGLAILAGLLVGAGLSPLAGSSLPPAWLLPPLIPVAFVSYLDDRASVPVITRLAAHLVGAVLLIWGGDLAFQIMPVSIVDKSLSLWIGAILVLVYVTWMINLYNFMDGMDGLAAGMAVIGFSCYAVMGWLSDDLLFAQSSLVIVGACSGFLLFNFPPARIFMGDVGSSVLGLLAAAFSLWGVRDGIFSFPIALLVFSPFIADASVTLLRRLFQKKTVWKPHKTHYYQQLVQSGWGHRKTVLAEYAVMLGCGVTAIYFVHAAVLAQFLAIAVWMAVYAVFYSWISRYASGRLRTE